MLVNTLANALIEASACPTHPPLLHCCHTHSLPSNPRPAPHPSPVDVLC